MLSPYIIAGLAGWIVSQLGKYAWASFRAGRLKDYRQLYLSGHMPSAHSATVVSLVVVVGALDGTDSAVFGVALLFAAVVLYDAMMVRRSSGEQGVALTALMKEQKSKVRLPRVALGHTPIEVAIGALLGLIVGTAVVYFTNLGLL